MKIAVFDVETTGFNPKMERILEFGAVVLDENGRELSSYNKIIWPREGNADVPYGAYKVHGIGSDMIKKEGVLWRNIAPKVHSILDEVDVHLGHNIHFDNDFMKEAFHGVDMNLPEKINLDTLQIARRFLPKETFAKKNLGYLCSRFGLDLSDAHRAVHDSRATGKLLFTMMKELDVKLEDLLESKPVCWGKYHFNTKHFSPFHALYNGLSRKIY